MSVKVLRSTLFLTAVLAVKSVSAIVRFCITGEIKEKHVIDHDACISAEPVGGLPVHAIEKR